MKSRTSSLALLVVSASLVAACTPKADLRMSVEVVANPGEATVSFKGKPVGSTPASLEVKTFDELMSIAARKEDAPVAEKRIRILSPERAQIVFRFGTEASEIAKKLGLAKVLVFDYSEKVSFDVGRSELKPEGLPVLNRQADILKKYFPNVDVFVCGHTDSTGSDALNLRLSLDRARVVASFLEARGLARERLKPQGFGKEYPIESNATPEGRAVNRRTELVLPQ